MEEISNMDLHEQLAETEAELDTISAMWLAGADLDHVITASAEVCARIYELREQLRMETPRDA